MARKVIGTHNGTFHCDEVLAIAMLKQLPEYKDADIIRTREMEKLGTCDIVVDVGGLFDASSHRYDHHQPSFNLTIKDFHPHLQPVVKLSSAGLIYAHFGKRVISEIAGQLNSDADLETLFKQQAFSKALALVTSELVESVQRLADVWLPAKTLVEKCLQSRFSVHPSGLIMHLTPAGCPWKEHFFELEKELSVEEDATLEKAHLPFSNRAVFLVTDRTNDFSVTAIPVAVDQPFSQRYQHPTAVCLVDLAATFDSVHRERLWQIMALEGVPPEILATIKAYYRSTTMRVLLHNNLSQPFGIRADVRQGCILSPILFNYTIDSILGRVLHEGDGVEFAFGHRLTDLDNADYIALLASSFDDLKSMLARVNEIRVYHASVRSVLLYGCECWAVCAECERKLEVFDHHCLRTILRVKYTDFVSKETVRARCDDIARITQAIQERRLRWFEHVLRRPPRELSVTVLDPVPLPGWRPRRGGQHKTRHDAVRQDMEVVLGPSVFGLRRWPKERVELSRSAAVDRHAWRCAVRDTIEFG
ncbi:hypothetical protein SprV_0401633600 [Sparganum proliferum]